MASKTFENFITLTQYFDSEDDVLENIELQTNQEEILGFFSKSEGDDWGWYSSPNQIKISLLLDGKIQEINKNNIKIQFITEESLAVELGELTEFLQNEDGEENKNQLYLNLFNLKNIEDLNGLKNVVQAIFKIVYNYNGRNVTKILPYRLGTSKDMAKLDINAGDITAAIQSTKLKFGPDGLEIFDGGLRIYDEPYQEGVIQNPVFKTTGTGGLYLKGEIEATNGSFTGTIHALDFSVEKGSIGGFTIDGSTLKSNHTYLSEKGEQVSSIILDGTEGKIIASSIVLGENAQIDNFIMLGDAKMYNPSKNENKLLESANICLKDDGTMTVGDIQIDGAEKGSIKCKDSWWINGNGTARFNDIYANNVHLQDAVLEATTIQSVGSLMLFKDSWFVQERNGNTITLDGTAPLNLSVEDYIYDGDVTYKIKEILEDGLTIVLDEEWPTAKTIVTKFGTPGEDFIFSLLGESQPKENQKGFSTGNSLTITEFFVNENTGKLDYKKVLVLGDLAQIDNNHSGTGLYAENVELYGSLTTQAQSEITTYAGINTKSTIVSDHFKEKVLIDDEETEKVEPIIFFAGAPNKNEINKAAFYVTDEGSLYASKGRFEGAVITNGSIEGGIIKAAKVYGTQTDGALSIYDTTGGIAFKKEDEETTLLINSNSFSIYDKEFIKIEKNNNDHKVTFIGQGLTINDINIIDNKIISSSSDKICFNGKSITFNEEKTAVEGCSFEVSNSKITSKVSANFYQDVNMGKDGIILAYKPVENGYNLYVQ